MAKRATKEDRRDFLKKGAAGFGAMVMLPSVMQQSSDSKTSGQTPDSKTTAQAEEKKDVKERATITRPLGRTGIVLPVVSMGCGPTENPELVKAALDAGVVMLDTAHNYYEGRNEEMIGGVIKGRPRDSYVICTKVAGSPEDTKKGIFTKDAKAGPFIERLEISLKRLGLDHVEILCLHGVVKREAVLWDEYMGAMQKLKKDGKIRCAGLSTHRNEPEVLNAAVDSKVYDVVVTAYNFRQPHVSEMKKAIGDAAKAGLGIVAMKTQAGVYWDRKRQRQINMKAALKWVLQDENVHTSIPGFGTFDQMEAALSVMEDLKHTPEEKKDLELGENLGIPGLYCPQCGRCLRQCQEELDIPTLMRSYMYAYGYRNLALAKDALDCARLRDLPCDDCGSCRVKCSMGFDVKARICDIARLNNVHRDFVS